MAEKITYYAIVDEFSSRDQPAGVLRRVRNDDGDDRRGLLRRPEVEHSPPLMYEAERGDLENEFVPVSEAEAMRIVERIRELTAPGD